MSNAVILRRLDAVSCLGCVDAAAERLELQRIREELLTDEAYPIMIYLVKTWKLKHVLIADMLVSLVSQGVVH